MEAIVGVFGVKAGYTSGVAPRLAAEVAHRLVGRGAELLVLGCTELPLVLTGAQFDAGERVVPLIDSTRVLADRLLARGGNHGIAGGLGPEATVDLLEKMGAPTEVSRILREILRATVELLGARRDQDHLKMIAATTPDPMLAARRLAQAGVDFFVLSPAAAAVAAAIEVATRLPVLVARADRPVGLEVVRYAAPAEP